MAQFESRKQILALFTGAFFLSFFIHMFIVAEAKKRFGSVSDEIHPTDEALLENGPGFWMSIKNRVGKRLLDLFKKKETPESSAGQRKLLSFEPGKEHLLRPRDKARESQQEDSKVESQMQIMRRLGSRQKIIVDILDAFCTCNDEGSRSSTNPPPCKNEGLEGKEPFKNSTLDLIKKALTDPVLAKKLFENYDICEINGWIFITAAIILTCIFNYTLVFCCCLCFYKRRPRTYSSYHGATNLISPEGKKLNHLDADFVETEQFLQKANEKGEVP